MVSVQHDLQRYLQKNIFPSRTVLVFPPFNGFRRFLIHKLIEDNFASSEVAAFSIGQDLSRRIVICYKGLIREAASKGLPATIPNPTKVNMIDKEKPSRHKQTPTAAVYRPPAARQAEHRMSSDISKPQSSKQTRVRRPDQQMYVPRPKRASYSSDVPRSRSRSNSRLSLDSDRSLEVVSADPQELENAREDCQPEGDSTPKDCQPDKSEIVELKEKIHRPEESLGCLTAERVMPQSNEESQEKNISETLINKSRLTGDKILKENLELIDVDISKNPILNDNTISILDEGNMQDDIQCNVHSDNNAATQNNQDVDKKTRTEERVEESDKTLPFHKQEETPHTVMETISLSSNSTSEESNSSMSIIDSNTSESSRSPDLRVKRKCKHKSSGPMDIDQVDEKNAESQSQLKEDAKISEILVISDSSSSDDCLKSSIKNNKDERSDKCGTVTKVDDVKVDNNSAKLNKIVDPDECDWESLYDDSGECLVPSLMEELTKSVGKVRVTSADSDYRPYQSIEERTNDGECVIEIYDFPAEFKTTDLFNVFASYSNMNLQIKWVDDTHALGIFPSPLMADEVLASTLPFVKTRPLRLGIAESRMKARNLVLPPLPSVERPKTCSALAKRLVSGALGLRLRTSPQEREKEKQVLKEAKEKRRLEAKQREAAWDGTLTSNSII